MPVLEAREPIRPRWDFVGSIPPKEPVSNIVCHLIEIWLHNCPPSSCLSFYDFGEIISMTWRIVEKLQNKEEDKAEEAEV